MKKQWLGVMMASVLALSALAGCSGGAQGGGTSANGAASSAQQEAAPAGGGVEKDAVKVGIIYIGDENEGYTEAHMKGIDGMQQQLGLSDDQILEKTNIADTEAAYDAAKDLVDQGCNIVFANSFGHETYLMQAAQENPEVENHTFWR